MRNFFFLCVFVQQVRGGCWFVGMEDISVSYIHFREQGDIQQHCFFPCFVLVPLLFSFAFFAFFLFFLVYFCFIFFLSFLFFVLFLL